MSWWSVWTLLSPTKGWLRRCGPSSPEPVSWPPASTPCCSPSRELPRARGPLSPPFVPAWKPSRCASASRAPRCSRWPPASWACPQRRPWWWGTALPRTSLVARRSELGRRCCSRGSPPSAARTSSSPTWSWPDCASCRPSWADRGELEGHMSKLRDPVRPPRPLVLITDCDHSDTDVERAIFAAAGLDVRLANCRTEDDVLAAGADAVALLVQYAPISAKVLAGLDRCQVVGRYGAGLDMIDLSAARTQGVEVVSVPDYSVQEVSDHTIALVLSLCRGIVAYAGAVRSGRWDMREGGVMRRLSTLRLGVIGLGRIGRLVAAKAAALNFEVVGYDVIPSTEPSVPLLSLEELLVTSDVVTLHVPLSTETHHLIDASRLALDRKSTRLNSSHLGI